MNIAFDFLGLTEHEVSIYQMLLASPFSTGSEIKKITGISNSRVYSALDSLIQKGFVSYKITAHGRLFSAVDPSALTVAAQERVKQIESLVPTLRALQSHSRDSTTSVIYEGFQGFKNAFNDMVQECPVGEMISIIGFSNQAYKSEKLRLLLNGVNTLSLKKKHKFKMILDSKQNIFYTDRMVEGISNIRFMNKGFVSPAAIDMFLDRVYIFLWDEQPYAFMIQNTNIAKGFKSYFNFLWGIAQPY
ncbi:MAG TPA: helix-turn-helix domain-containing protein [Candidatus Nanoarchaeia archaeon]|nr:helix-turn-helix domain-containing protein [Candidatus Nanoarchaeia archaeon]